MIYYKDRIELAQRMPKNGIVAEVGVLEGDYSQVILSESTPSALYLIDAWETQADDYARDPYNTTNFTEAYKRVLAKFGHVAAVRVMKAWSPQIARFFADEYFDWLYLDANHLLEPVYADVCTWWPKIKVGGYLCGHDYVTTDWIEVIPALTRFMESTGAQLYALTSEPWSSWCIRKEPLN